MGNVDMLSHDVVVGRVITGTTVVDGVRDTSVLYSEIPEFLRSWGVGAITEMSPLVVISPTVPSAVQ